MYVWRAFGCQTVSFDKIMHIKQNIALYVQFDLVVRVCRIVLLYLETILRSIYNVFAIFSPRIEFARVYLRFFNYRNHRDFLTTVTPECTLTHVFACTIVSCLLYYFKFCMEYFLWSDELVTKISLKKFHLKIIRAG